MKKNIFLSLSVSLSAALLMLSSCASDVHEGYRADGYDLVLQKQRIINDTKAVKSINPYDELGCEIYDITNPKKTEGTAFLDYEIGDDQKEGSGSFKLKYNFTGTPNEGDREFVYFQQRWGDYRVDLSFHPLGLSIWVKGNSKNKDAVFRFIIMEDEKQFSEDAPHDYTRKRWSYYAYEDTEVLSKDGWTRLIMPYSAFKQYKKGEGTQSDQLLMNRNEGFRIEIENAAGGAWNGECQIDNLEQLTSYELKGGTPMFSSIFIQLNKDAYEDEDWDQQFKDSRAVGIDTWIIQYSEQFTGNDDDTNVSFYKNTNLPWVDVKCDLIDKMFEAAARNGMKIILGLYPGDYSKRDLLDPTKYNINTQRNKMLFDEVYEQFGNNPCLVGWYITEEFHDGSYPVGWQQEPELAMLAKYLEGVASYIKSKSNKPVAIAPALWRGLPADLCGKWFESLFKRTPNIDNLYLQDIGGRCLVDFDVDLPNWYAEIKKACDATNVKFGVDIESFKSCNCPNIGYKAKDWVELKEQLMVAGLFTKYITNFSWVTFKKGTNNYEGYKAYLKENNLLPEEK